MVKQVSRRDVLRAGLRGAVGLGAASLLGCGENRSKEKPSAGRVEITQKGEVVSENILESGGYRVFLDKDAVPYKYLDPEGVSTLFDNEKMKMAQTFAVENREPEVAHIISVPKASLDIGIPISTSTEKPFVKDLPEDVLSETELARRGVKIIQSDNTNLYIRKQAFDKEGPLAHFDGTRKLIIVAVNSSVVVPGAVSGPKYLEVAHLLNPLNTTIEEYRDRRIFEVTKHLEKARSDLKRSQSQSEYTSPQLMNSLESIVLETKTVLYRFENTSTDEELLAEASSTISNKAGLYYNPAISGMEDTAVIFVAAGTMQKTKEEIEIIFDTNGKCSLLRSSFTIVLGDFSPNTADSFPSPRDFVMNSNAKADDPNAYPYGGQTVGLVLRHELAHDKLVWESEKPNISEYDTDIKAMEGIREASERWNKFRDNSGYYFVFSLPDSSGYILTAGKPLAESATTVS